MNITKIQWTDFTANPIKYRDRDGLAAWACVKVSAGCANCYAEALAKRYKRGGAFTVGNMDKRDCYLDEKELNAMLRSPRLTGKRVFVGDMTDAFGEWVPVGMLDRMFAVFALRPDVTWQVLTKRPERMREYLMAPERQEAIGWGCTGLSRYWVLDDMTWPLPNVWLGVSVEDQAAADSRIPELLATPAAVHFLSCEPLLGPVSLNNVNWQAYARAGLTRVLAGRADAALRDILASMDEPGAEPHSANVLTGEWFDGEDVIDKQIRISWVIAGGESGPGARPCGVAWIRSIVAQCRAADVPVFVKQLGSRPCVTETSRYYMDDGSGWHEPGVRVLRLRHSHGGDPAEWPEDLRVREWPG